MNEEMSATFDSPSNWVAVDSLAGFSAEPSRSRNAGVVGNEARVQGSLARSFASALRRCPGGLGVVFVSADYSAASRVTCRSVRRSVSPCVRLPVAV